MSKMRASGVTLALVAPMLLAGLPVLAAQKAEVIKADHYGLSAPVWSMPVDQNSGPEREVVHKRIPGAPVIPIGDVDDPVLQEVTGPTVRTTPGLNVMGEGNGFPGFTVELTPPDTNAAVGATQVVETVNIQYAVFNKSTGAIAAGPTNLGNIWAGVDPTGCGSGSLADPVVLYDQQAARWVVQLITVNTPFKICIAVSSTSDATGTYHAYSFTDSAGLPDYDKLGIWTDAYYTSVRQFNTTETSYLGPKACASDRTAMLAGSAATMQCIQISNGNVDGMLPANLDGATAPPSGSAEYFMLLPLPDSGSATTLQLYQFHYVQSGGSTLTGPANITVAKYTEAASFGGDVPQSGTTDEVDALGFTLMYRLAYRNFAGTGAHESLVVTHSVAAGTSSSRRYGTRWYEIRSPGTTPVVYQQGTFSPDATYRWCGSIAMDKLGNIALGYSASSSSIHPGVRYTGRAPSDPLGKMETEAVIYSGTGSEEGSGQPGYRWGDYSSMSIDPADDCTFWYSNEYIPTNGSFNWSTHLFSFKFNNCH